MLHFLMNIWIRSQSSGVTLTLSKLRTSFSMWHLTSELSSNTMLFPEEECCFFVPECQLQTTNCLSFTSCFPCDSTTWWAHHLNETLLTCSSMDLASSLLPGNHPACLVCCLLATLLSSPLGNSPQDTCPLHTVTYSSFGFKDTRLSSQIYLYI